jgi:hypothetical protein
LKCGRRWRDDICDHDLPHRRRRKRLLAMRRSRGHNDRDARALLLEGTVVRAGRRAAVGRGCWKRVRISCEENEVMKNDGALREQLIRSLNWGDAHTTFDDTVNDLPADVRGRRPEGGPHSAWELLEHLRITLWDILEFSRDAKHVSPEWPSGYWPASEAPADDAAWDASVAAYREHLRELSEVAGDESVDLYARIPHGDGQTVLREILLAIDHNAYHLGQLVMVKKTLAKG